MATYGGLGLFGNSIAFSISSRPRELQTNSFFGLDGIEVIDGGSRGRTSTITGVLVAQDAAGLASAESSIRNRIDGIARDLVDDTGSSWPNVLLEEFLPQGRVRRASDGRFFRTYRARFLHLV